MAYSQDNFSQFDVPGEDFPIWMLIVLTLIGIVGSILTMYLIQSANNRTAIPDQQAELVTFPDQSKQTALPGLADQQVSLNQSKQTTLPGLTDQQIPSGQTKPVKSKPIIKQAKLTPNSSQSPVIQPPVIQSQTKRTLSNTSDCPPEIYFSFAINATTPKWPGRKENIKKVKDWLKNHPHDPILLSGYASPSGTVEHNLLLSYQRAKSVKALLMRAGIDQNQLIIRAFGEYAISQRRPESTSQRKRRVSLLFETTANCMNKEDTRS
ncbi:MAG: OmpA family protein [Methylococcaceae bacterium]|nr:OmpA family protein [Methylococcaceae bacterium]